MTMRQLQSLACVACVAFSMTSAAAQTTTPNGPADAANPELVGQLATELGATPAQAAGAAGALFGIAKRHLPEGDWSKVSAAVPGMDQLLAAAPLLDAVAGGGGGSGGAVAAAASALGAAGGGAGGVSNLLAAAGAFQKLGLDPALVGKAVPVLSRYVTKTGGSGVGNLLAGVLK